MKGYLKEAASFISVFYRTTALGPVLIADTLLFLLFGLSLVPGVPPFMQITITVLFAAAIMVTLYQILFFTHKDPNRLALQEQVHQRYLVDKIYGDESHDMARATLAAAIFNPKLSMTQSDVIPLPEGTEKQPDAPDEPPQLV